MRSLITLIFIFAYLYIVTALAVPHLHPEESKIDIAIKLAAANVPENDHCFSKNDENNAYEGEYFPNQDKIHVATTDKSSLRKRDESFLPYEHDDDISDLLELSDVGYIDEIDKEHYLKRRTSLDTSWETDAGYFPIRNQDFDFLDKRDEDFFEEIDVDDLSWKRNILDGNGGLLNECLWKFKKDDNCIERNDENKLGKRNGEDYPELDYQNHWRFTRDEDVADVGDEKYWTFRRVEDYADEADYSYALMEDDYYDDKEKEYLRKRYEDYSGEGGKYFSRGDEYFLDSEAEADLNQEGSEWSFKEVEDNYSWQTEDKGVCDAYDYTNEINDHLCGAEMDGGKCSLGTGKASKSPTRLANQVPSDLSAKNDYLCETTEGSPVVKDVVDIATKFINGKKKLRCRAGNMLGSNCTKLGGLGSAQIGICSIHSGWFVYCDNAGKYVLELSKRCKREIKGTWRVGGTIFHEDRRGRLIVY